MKHDEIGRVLDRFDQKQKVQFLNQLRLQIAGGMTILRAQCDGHQDLMVLDKQYTRALSYLPA